MMGCMKTAIVWLIAAGSGAITDVSSQGALEPDAAFPAPDPSADLTGTHIRLDGGLTRSV